MFRSWPSSWSFRPLYYSSSYSRGNLVVHSRRDRSGEKVPCKMGIIAPELVTTEAGIELRDSKMKLASITYQCMTPCLLIGA